MRTAPRQDDADRFAEALSPRLMGPRLAAALGADGPTHVLDAKFEPGLRAELLYEHAGQLVRGDLVPTGTPAHGGAGVVEPGVVLSPFPHDPDLPGLPAVMDPTTLADALTGALPVMPDTRPLTARCRVRLLRYRPGKRATVLVTGGGASYIAKVYHQEHKAAAVAQEAPRLLGAAPRHGELAFAPVAGVVPGLRVVVQHVVAGTPLDSLIGSRGTTAVGLAGAVERAAQALAEFHALPLVSGRVRPVDAELHRFTLRADRIATVDPVLGRAAARLAHRLTRVHTHLPAPRTGTVHGDCKPSQFLLSADRVHLLDLDHCGTSDQAGDVGTFLATLRQLEVRHSLAGRLPVGATAFAGSAELFLCAYLRSAGPGRDLARIRWQEAVALERKALRAFARAPRSPLAGALIDEAQRCLDNLKEAA
jgi:hypothetical protein